MLSPDHSLPLYGYAIGILKNFCVDAVPDMPPEAWWVAALVLLVLGAAAAIDAFTATVPDPLIFFGMLAVTALQGIYISWPFASVHLALALGAAFTLGIINMAWHWILKQDAFGMGDAKWTMLAVATFDVLPSVFAWGFGACLAVVWLGGTRLVRYPMVRVYFAPFLFVGLVAGLYWLRVR